MLCKISFFILLILSLLYFDRTEAAILPDHENGNTAQQGYSNYSFTSCINYIQSILERLDNKSHQLSKKNNLPNSGNSTATPLSGTNRQKHFGSVGFRINRLTNIESMETPKVYKAPGGISGRSGDLFHVDGPKKRTGGRRKRIKH